MIKVLFNVSWNSGAIKRLAGYLGLYYCGPNCPGYDPTYGPCPYCK